MYFSVADNQRTPMDMSKAVSRADFRQPVQAGSYFVHSSSRRRRRHFKIPILEIPTILNLGGRNHMKYPVEEMTVTIRFNNKSILSTEATFRRHRNLKEKTLTPQTIELKSMWLK